MKKTVSFSILIIFLFSLATLVGCAPRKKNNRYPSGRLKPGTAEFYLHEGIFYLNAGDIKTAEEKIQKALKKNPTLLGAINAMGIVYLQKREFPQAIENFNQVIRNNPESWDAYNYLGVIYTELNEYNLAKENLLRVANSDKYRYTENAYVNLAMLEIKQNRYDAALRYVEKGMDKNDRFPPLSNLMGIILEHEEKYEDALVWYEKALAQLTEEDVSYLVNVGRVYSKMGQRGKALDVLEKALSKAFAPALKEQIRQMIKEIEE